MLVKLTVTLTIVVAAMSTSIIAQSSASASPTPKPATRRPGLDQFGVSSGVFSTSGSASTSANASLNDEPVTKEYIDAEILDTIMVSIEKAQFLEEELNRVLAREPNIDMTTGLPFAKYFIHNTVGLARVSSAQRKGTYGGSGIRPGQITKLLEENEFLIYDISLFLGSRHERPETVASLKPISEKYGVPLLTAPVNGSPFDMPAVLRSIMRRINSNNGRLKRIMVARK